MDANLLLASKPAAVRFIAVLVMLLAARGQSDAGELRSFLEPTVSLTRGPYLQSGTVSNIIVRWRTDLPSDSRVQFGGSADALNWVVGDSDSTTEHIVTLTNLAPGTRYYYAIGHGEGNLAGGPDYYFVTAPPAGKPTRIWAIGDCGVAAVGVPGSRMVRDAYYAFTGDRETEVWLMLGDNAYLTGTDEEYQAAVFDVYQNLLRRNVLWSTIGNHETYSPLPGGGISYYNIFSFPKAGEAGGVASGTKNYYSFNYGNIHFVCLDSELSDHTPGSPMWTWLEQDLEANTNDWLIAFWHSPPYTKGSHDSDSPFDTSGHLVEMREQALPILESHGVDLVLCGHSHCYERSFLLDGHYGYSETLVPSMVKDAGSGQPGDSGAYRKSSSGPAANQGAVYIVAGCAGWTTGGPLNHPAMFVSLNQLGSIVLDVNGQRLDGKFLRETGEIDDHFTILKGAAPEPLRFASIYVKDGLVTARWKSVAGSTYRIESAASLVAAEWRPASDAITATGATSSWSDYVDVETQKYFYRVAQVAP